MDFHQQERGRRNNWERHMPYKHSFRLKIFALLFASLLPIAAIGPLSANRASANRAPENQAPDRTWITDVTIISPEKLDHIEKGSVLIEHDRLARVERKKGA